MDCFSSSRYLALRHILLLLFTAFFFTSNLVAQEVVKANTSYYKDSKMTKPCEAVKAKSKSVETFYSGGTSVYEVYDIKKGFERLRLTRSYKNGHPSGIWATYDSKGRTLSKYDFSKLAYAKDSIAGGNYFDLLKNDTLDFEPPKYAGGNKEWYTFLGTTTNYPNIAKELGMQGRVFVHVKIDDTGKLHVLSIFRGVSPYLDAETWRVLELSPDWAPATKDGVAIDSYTVVSFEFRLQ